ncbi:6576_t:CDS:2, partial [Racocetra fulgida]
MTSRVLIFGGSGELGSALVVTSVGTRQNSDATHNIIIPVDDPLEIQGEKVLNQSNEQLKSDNAEKYDAILCVAGGFMMGNLVDKDGFLMLTGTAGLQGTPGNQLINFKLAVLAILTFIQSSHFAKAGVQQLVKSLSAE